MSDDKPTLDELLTEIPEIRQWMRLLLAANGPDTLSVKHFTEALSLIDALLSERERLTAALAVAQGPQYIDVLYKYFHVDDAPASGEGSDE